MNVYALQMARAEIERLRDELDQVLAERNDLLDTLTEIRKKEFIVEKRQTSDRDDMKAALGAFLSFHDQLDSLISNGATKLPTISRWVIDEARTALAGGE